MLWARESMLSTLLLWLKLREDSSSTPFLLPTPCSSPSPLLLLSSVTVVPPPCFSILHIIFFLEFINRQKFLKESRELLYFYILYWSITYGGYVKSIKSFRTPQDAEIKVCLYNNKYISPSRPGFNSRRGNIIICSLPLKFDLFILENFFKYLLSPAKRPLVQILLLYHYCKTRPVMIFMCVSFPFAVVLCHAITSRLSNCGISLSHLGHPNKTVRFTIVPFTVG